MTTTIENWYRRWEGTVQLLILIMIPLAVFLYGRSVTNAVERQKTEQEYVRIATGILSQKVEENDDQSAIRSWAADVLAKYSPIMMSDEQRQKLVTGAARTSLWGTTDYYSYGSTYGGYDYDVPDTKTPKNQTAEQGSAGQPATRLKSKPEGSDKPQPEAEGRSR
jgi:hypothetical protein